MDSLTPPHAVSYPWGDLRLWAFPLLLGALGGLADAAWGGVFPGRAPAIWAASLAAGLVAAGTTATALHPRAARWTAAGNVAPVLGAILLAFALARPVSGPAFWAFAWSCGLLLYCWSKARSFAHAAIRPTLAYPFGRRAELAPPEGANLTGAAFSTQVAHASVDLLWGVGLWVALCDLGQSTLPPADLTPLALAAVASVLLVASWANRAHRWSEARGVGVRIQGGFSRQWWWAIIPVLCLSLIIGLLVPLYSAPLQHGSVGSAVVRFASFWAPRLQPGRHALGSLRRTPAPGGDPRTVTILVLLLVVLALAWPLRRATNRLLARLGLAEDLPIDAPLEPRVRPAERWRHWWARWGAFWRRFWRRGRPILPEGRWRPLAPPPVHHPGPPPLGPDAARDDPRGRVRAAYGRFLLTAGRLGLGRAVGHTPASYRAWLHERAPAGQAALAKLTQAYEEARYSRHVIDPVAAVGAESDAQAAQYALDTFTRSRRGRPAPPERLHWTAPRGFGRGKQTS